MTKSPKKLYVAPALVRYGTVQQLTKKVGMNGNHDGSRFPRTKTHI